MTETALRPFRDEDRDTVIEGRNKHRPAHHHSTVAEWGRDDARRAAEQVSLRLCIGEPATAYLSVVDRSTTPRRKPDVCGFDLWIASEHRSDALADVLYTEALAFARSRSAKRLTTVLTIFSADDPMLPFLARHGFTEVDRLVSVMLDLSAFAPAQFVSPAPDGTSFFSYAEAGDTEENRRRLYALAAVLDRDAPTHDVRSEPPFEEFVKRFDRPEWNNDALILAASGSGEWIGAGQLHFQEHTGIAWTFLTVILPEYRGRGIALALKLRTIDAARARGCPLILTENHEDNAPMRAINKKLGFVPDAPEIRYSKNLM